MTSNTSTLSACDTLIAEHREMEGFLDILESLMAQAPAEKTKPDAQWLDDVDRILETISAHINTHFACEEQGLFPRLEKYHPMVLMEAEHEELVALRDQTLTHFKDNALAAMKDKALLLSKELRDHIAREDGGIFPAAERDMSEPDKQAAVEAMDAIRKAAQSAPTPTISRPARTFVPFTTPGPPGFDRPVNVQKLLEAEGTSVKELDLKAGEALAAHWSPHPLVLYCLSGKARFEAHGDSQELTAGKGLYVSPQLKHALYASENSRFLLVFIPGQ